MAEGGQSSSLSSALRNLWTSNGLPEEFLRHLKLRGDADSAVNSSFRLGLAAQIAIGLAGLSSAYLHYLCSGVEQDVSVDARHAALSFHSEAWYTVGEALPAGEVWDSIAGLYPTKGGGWVRIHTNFSHHRKGVLDILRIAETAETQALRSQVAEALLTWDSEHLEDECARHGMCVAAMRSYDEWQKHPHAKALIGVPPLEIRRVDQGTVPTTKFADDSKNRRPLEGVKVLDLSRVLAGPVAGRTLAGLTVYLAFRSVSDLKVS
ncbi:hypothetical protein NLJ89_g11137 [Agrocybe chaxingu]|uniref:Uncharacterized protein n=1 Tax=Agrocybe chaxingu TaxID=84603 RepID=A0A9W8JXC2_9AGAR|nr:hypothetical protein NLJ89_g11137 [Agrocybe chaxingu]